MAIHEIEKNIKIIDEIVLLLFNKGYHKFDFSLDYTEEESLITVLLDDPEKILVEKIQNELHIERDEELEDYGWELLGECSEHRETIYLGMLVDSMDLGYEGGKAKIVFHRKH